MTVTIRDSGQHEAETLFAIQKAASLAGNAHVFPPELYPYPDDAIRERWRTMHGRIFLAEDDGEPVGVAAIEGEWLNGFYVVPHRWGTGVADVLHTAAVEAIAAAHEEARLWVLDDNRRARRYYEKRGWRLNGETRVVEYPPNPLDVGYSLALPRSA